MTRQGVLSRIRNVWRTLTNRDTPRDLQERSELYQTALALSYRQHRIDYAASASTSASGAKTHTNTKHIQALTDRTILGDLFDKASGSLEVNNEVHELPIRSLRLLVQKSIGPQVEDILQACKAVDDDDMRTRESLRNANFDIMEQTQMEKDEIIDFCKDLLTKERHDIEHKMEDFKIHGGENASSSDALRDERAFQYLEQKLSALRTISTFYNWETDTFETPTDGDALGYHISSDEEVNNSIRYYQMMNLTRALLVRKRMGYAPLALQSTIPSAGRGVFVDGFAPAGSLVTFFPGDVWPKEYLTNIEATSKIFKDDPKQQLSIRYDDILIDSRKSPYTVLDNDNFNLFALGHIVNHPPKPKPKTKPKKYDISGDDNRDDSDPDHNTITDTGVNCSTVMIDFVEKMELEKKQLYTYVPNIYKKPPMIYGAKAMDLEPIAMHGFGLIASRDLENEELFFDYRLSPGGGSGGDGHPDWYHLCDTDGQHRWS